MDTANIFLNLALILLAARIGAEIANKFGVPAVIGELSAGIILGPSLFGWIELNEVIQLLAEIGIIMLLFEVGLNTDLGRLAKAGPKSAIVAAGGFVLPFSSGYCVSHFIFDQPPMTALFVGGTLTATSIGVTVRVLQDVGRQASTEGQIVLGAAVLDDILGVLMLAFLYHFSQSGEIDLLAIARLTLLIVAFFALAPIAAKVLANLMFHYRWRAQLPGIIATIIVSLMLVSAWGAHLVGAPELLGGFTAGIALSRRFMLPFGASLGQNAQLSHEVEREMKPIIQLFTPIFFVAVGLSLDLSAVDWLSPFIWTFSIGFAVVAIAAKIAAGFLLWREHWLLRTAVGMAMVPRGEVGLIFAELGRVAGLFDPSTYAGIVLVIAYTTMLSPFWIKLFYKIYGKRPELSPDDG